MSERKRCIQTINIWGEQLPVAFWKCGGDDWHSDFDNHRDCGLTPADRKRCEAHHAKYVPEFGEEEGECHEHHNTVNDLSRPDAPLSRSDAGR